MSDPRLTLARPDLAAASLEGVVAAAAYRPTTAMQVAAHVAPLRRAAGAGAEQLSQLLFGERFDVLETVGDFAWGQAARDGYVGWVERAGLGSLSDLPTHRVVAVRTPTFVAANIKAPLMHILSMNSLVTLRLTDGALVEARGAGWMPASHLAPIGSDFADDPAGVAERFIGAPYLWGGRASLGLDCSGLIQQALHACGRACPRDSDMQQALGASLQIGPDLAGLRRNDLVFWRGHVGIMLDAARLLHANAHHMAVTVEPLASAVARIDQAGAGLPTAYRRL